MPRLSSTSTSARLGQSHRYHEHGDAAIRVDSDTITPTVESRCGACAATQRTLAAHLRRIGLVSVVLLVTNAVLAVWVLVARRPGVGADAVV